jgi:hypothetical protein
MEASFAICHELRCYFCWQHLLLRASTFQWFYLNFYSGLFNTIGNNQSALVAVLAIFGLALIGGLAMLCFTKAWYNFLGNERYPYKVILMKPAGLHCFQNT